MIHPVHISIVIRKTLREDDLKQGNTQFSI